MAKKKNGKGAGHRDTEEMTKSQLKAYHKEICEFYEENGWRQTLSHFLLSPAQAKEITAKTRLRMEKEAAREKEAKAKARASKKGKATSKKKKAPPKAPKKKAAKKEAASKKKTTKKETASKPAAKKATRRKAAPKAPARRKAANGEALEGALDYLLDYRKKNPNVPLDTAIADLTTQVRAA